MLRKIFTWSVVVLTIFWAVGLAAFVPVAQAATLSSGDLIKASLPAVYYYGADGSRYVFPDEKTYMTWYSDFSTVKTITDGELAAIPIGGNVTYRPGTKMVKITTDPKVYAVAANGTLRWVETESIANSLYGSDWASMVQDVSDPFFVNYTVGDPISDASDFDPAAATASATSINVDKGLAAAGEGGPLALALASDTPAAATVAAGASADFTKVTLSAGASDVSITSIRVTRYGLSANSDVENIKFIDANGTQVGSSGSLNTNGQALITFVPTLKLAAGESKTLRIRASIAAAAASGKTVALGIATADDVVGAATTGAFPITGNYMSVVSLTIGSAQVAKDGSVVDSTPDAGDENVTVNQFKISAGSTEDITVEAITGTEAGTASLSDTANIELYSVSESRSLGEASWNSEGKVTWGNLGIVIPRGTTHRFKIMADIVSGSGLTVNVDITDGTDALVTVKGNTYGFYITPTISGGWDGKGTDQNINSGSLNVSKSINTAPTGNIVQASERELATFALEARGEPIKVTSWKVSFKFDPELDSDTTGFDVDSNDDGTDNDIVSTDLNQVYNVRIYDENGDVVAGPKDLTAQGNTIYQGYVTFTDTIIVDSGDHDYTVKADIATTASSGDDLQVAVADASTEIVAKGLNTNDSITPTPAATAVLGNTQTVAGAALTATTSASIPAARNVAAGTQNMVWSIFSLDAAASGEDIQVTSLELEDTLGAAGHNAADIDNVEIFCDLTDGLSARGDAYETKVSDSEQPDDDGVDADEELAVVLNQTIVIPMGDFVTCAVVADLNGNAAAGETHTISLDTDAGDVTANGADTGNVVTVTPSGTGQTMTVQASGILTTTISSSSPDKQILVSGDQMQSVAVYKFAADDVEDIEIDDVTVTDVGAGNVATTLYLYSSSRADGGSTADPVATASMGNTGTAGEARFDIADNTVVIPSDGNVTLTVKVDVAPVDGTTVTNGSTLQADIAATADVTATGRSSGATINASATITTAATHVAYASKPTVSLNASSPSGSLVPSVNSLLAIFNITADSADDISFENGDANSLTVEVSASCSTGTADELFTLKDASGNALATPALVDICSSPSVQFLFEDKDLTVSKGQTSKVYVYADTSEMTTNGDSVQLWLDDSTVTNIDWGVGGVGSYNVADVIFRGDIFANALVKG